MGKRHWSNYLCNFVDLCSGVNIVWSTTTRTRVNDATAVTFSVKCVNPLKLYPLSGNISRKWFASYVFIHSRAVNNNVMFNGKSYYYNDTFTDSNNDRNSYVVVFAALRNVGRRQTKGISRRTFHFYAKTRWVGDVWYCSWFTWTWTQ